MPPIPPSIAAAGVTGGANFATSLMNNLFNLHSQNKTNKLNYQMFREGNEFAAQEAQKAFDRESDFAWDMFNAENEYNTPLAMLQRLQAAGLSPFDYFSNGNYVGASGNSVTGFAAQPSSPVPMHAPTLDINASGAVESFAKILGALSDRKLKSAEADRILKLTGAEFEKMLSEKNYTDTLNANAEFDRFLKEYKLPYEIQNMMADYRRLLTQGDLNEANKLLANAEESKAWEESKTARELRPYLLRNARRLYDVYSSEIEKNRASASESSAHAGLLGLQQTYQDHMNAIADYEREYKTLDYGAKAVFIKNNADAILTEMRRALDASNMSEWKKFEMEKRLKGYYERINNANDDSKAVEFMDHFWMFLNRDFPLRLAPAP